MKKIFLFLPLLTLFFSCSNDDNNEEFNLLMGEWIQHYTHDEEHNDEEEKQKIINFSRNSFVYYEIEEDGSFNHIEHSNLYYVEKDVIYYSDSHKFEILYISKDSLSLKWIEIRNPIESSSTIEFTKK